jgi:Tfp pilus assembly PilM family ATPase
MSQATEKLLHVITGQSKPETPPASKDAGRRYALKIRKERLLGVDFGVRGLRMVLSGGDGNVFLASRHTPYPRGLTPSDNEFPAFLGEEALALCGQLKNLKVWSHIVSPRVELFPLKMPKIPAWEMGEMVTWRVRKDHPFDDSEFIMDFAMYGEVMDQGAAKMAVLACLAPRKDVARLRALFIAAGLPLSGLTVAPLAFEALFRSQCCQVPDGSFALLNIAETSSRIDLYTDRKMLLSRVIKTGMSSMAEALSTACSEPSFASQPSGTEEAVSEGGSHPIDVYAESVQAEDDVEIVYNLEDLEEPSSSEAPHEQEGSSSREPLDGLQDTLPQAEQPDRLEFSSESSFESPSDSASESAPESASEPSPGPSLGTSNNAVGPELDDEAALDLLLHKLAGTPEPTDVCPSVSEEQVFSIIQPVCDRLARQVERTFDYTVRSLGHSRPGSLLLVGDLSMNQEMQGYFAAELGAEIRSLDALGPESSMHSAAAAALSLVDRRRLNLAASLTCSEKHGAVNMLRPFPQRQKAQGVQRANLAVYGVAIVVLLIMTLFFFLEHASIKERKETLSQLNTRLAAFEPKVDEPMLMRLAARIGQEHARLDTLSANLQPVAMLGEISRITPENIYLLHLRLAPAVKAEKKEDGKKAGIVMEALITDPTGNLDSALTGYLFVLGRSNLYSMPVVQSQEREQRPGLGEALRVVLHLDSPI